MRLQEAITRMLVSSLMEEMTENTWLNPTEVRTLNVIVNLYVQRKDVLFEASVKKRKF